MKIYLAQIYLSINKKEMKNYVCKTKNISSILESYYYINKKWKLIEETKEIIQGKI